MHSIERNFGFVAHREYPTESLRMKPGFGFGRVQALRHHFGAKLSISPRDYRRTLIQVRMPVP